MHGSPRAKRTLAGNRLQNQPIGKRYLLHIRDRMKRSPGGGDVRGPRSPAPARSVYGSPRCLSEGAHLTLAYGLWLRRTSPRGPRINTYQPLLPQGSGDHVHPRPRKVSSVATVRPCKGGGGYGSPCPVGAAKRRPLFSDRRSGPPEPKPVCQCEVCHPRKGAGESRLPVRAGAGHGEPYPPPPHGDIPALTQKSNTFAIFALMTRSA